MRRVNGFSRADGLLAFGRGAQEAPEILDPLGRHAVAQCEPAKGGTTLRADEVAVELRDLGAADQVGDAPAAGSRDAEAAAHGGANIDPRTAVAQWREAR